MYYSKSFGIGKLALITKTDHGVRASLEINMVLIWTRGIRLVNISFDAAIDAFIDRNRFAPCGD